MLMPYLHYKGNCEEAFRLYAAIFGGKLESLSRFTAETGPASLVGKVMHATVSLGEGRGFLSGSDQEDPVPQSGSIELLFHCRTPEEGRRILSLLGKDGHISSDFLPHPPPDDDGMGALVTDPFGYAWILSAPNDRAAPASP